MLESLITRSIAMPIRRPSIAALNLFILFHVTSPLHARSAKDVFELRGKIVPSQPRMLRSSSATVSLHSTSTSFSTRTLAHASGQFKFKNLHPGMYTLIIAVPQVRVLRRTVDIGPSLADTKGRIFLSIPFQPLASNRRSYTVSTTQLAIPENARLEYRKAQEYLERRDTERARDCLEKAVDLAPHFAGAWNLLGTIAYQSDRLEDAEKYFRAALNQSPNFYGAIINLGGALLSQGKASDGLNVYLRAVRVRPDDPMAQARLGLSYLYVGQLDKAEEHLKEAENLEPGHFSFPQLLLAEVYARRGDRDSALKELEQFLKLHPDSDRAPAVRKTLEQLRVQ